MRVIKILISAVLAFFISGCAPLPNRASSQNKDVPAFSRAATDLKKIQLSLSPETMRLIRSDPAYIKAAFDQVKNELKLRLGAKFSILNDADLFIVFSSIVSYLLAPYGHSTATELSELLKEPRLDCDQYALAVGHLCKYNKGVSDTWIEIIGWYGGFIGDHAQIFSSNPHSGVKLLLDPTVGIAALADFDHVASGKRISRDDMIDFSSRSEMGDEREKIIRALADGEYKPSDLYYYFEDVDSMIRVTKNIQQRNWPPDYVTPGALKFRRGYKK